MLCSLKVDQKGTTDHPDGGDPSTAPKQRFRSEWEEFLHTATSQWVKDRPPAPARRNVGGSCKKKWGPFEDAVLLGAVARVGTDRWRSVAPLVPGRTAKQCRERWLSHWSPDIATGEWSPEEDLRLLENQAAMGNQWAQIKTALPGRSISAVKNRWIWLCRRDIPRHATELGELAKARPLKADAEGTVKDSPE
jgi:hypothetical protein